VELAVALPILLLLIVGVIEVSFMMWTQLSLNYAVEQAARCGALNTTACNTSAKIQSYAAAQAFGIPDLTTANFTVSQAGATACGTGAQVTASYDFESMVMGILPYSLTIRATSCYP
jgi:Flp pilus assembly protein TadG